MSSSVRMIGKSASQTLLSVPEDRSIFFTQFLLTSPLSCRRNRSRRKADIAVNFTDSMFKGIYNGRQCHAADIPTVLARAWSAGVDRIIVMLLLSWGSLHESKEALAIAETDGWIIGYRSCYEGRLYCTVGVHPTRCKVEFEDSGDPDRYFQALVSLAREGIEKGKVHFK
ncbi:hypothetical protein ZIOFF_026245 [Zingiber officinale]|uniref:Uncharacterized protein n=1 Tax=Zingiber officinale TaxID=94328 RepID=A0A8J5HE08_ZINOF|nr:hypothetical protein ZIOFF_026245 [Zingiber officinale]